MLLASALFLAVVLTLGYWISAATKSQLAASQISLVVSFLPTFLLSGLPAGFSDADLAADLANVAFQYGTALNDRTEPCIGACELQGAPEPSMPLLLGAGLLAWGVTRRYVERRA